MTNETHEARVARWDAKLDQLEARFRRLQGQLNERRADVQVSVRQQLDQVGARLKSFRDQLSDWKEQGSLAVEEAQEGLAGASQDVQAALDAIGRRFSSES